MDLILANFEAISHKPELLVMLTKHVINCLIDKNPELRKLAEQLLGQMIEVVGRDQILHQVHKLNLKPAISRTINPILQKYEKKINSLQRSLCKFLNHSSSNIMAVCTINFQVI